MNATIMGDVVHHISFGVGRTNEERVEHELFDDAEAWKASDMGEYRQKAGVTGRASGMRRRAAAIG